MQEKMKNLQEQVSSLKKNIGEEQLKYKKLEQEMKEKLKAAEDVSRNSATCSLL